MKRKICVFTGTRAEYGILRPLLYRLKKDKDIMLQIIASGTHLSEEFGMTYRGIENDGFRIDKKVKILSKADKSCDIAASLASCIEGVAKAYNHLKPDIVVIAGDRFEALGAASAATICGIPIAHIHGGELTLGVIDEPIRHSITKMSHLHFVTTETYRNRVIQLGENPGRVFNTGSLSLESIKEIKFLPKEELEKSINFKLNKMRNLLITFHPVTLEAEATHEQFRNILKTVDSLENTHLIFTKANADKGGRAINRMIDQYASLNSRKARAFSSMGQINYFSALRLMDGVLGNSSSGIIEAPSFKIGTIDIGDRQKGRIKPESVISCEPDKRAIKKAVDKLYSDEFQRKLKKIKNPYDSGRPASKEVFDALKAYGLKGILKKEFYDIPFKVRKV